MTAAVRCPYTGAVRRLTDAEHARLQAARDADLRWYGNEARAERDRLRADAAEADRLAALEAAGIMCLPGLEGW